MVLDVIFNSNEVSMCSLTLVQICSERISDEISGLNGASTSEKYYENSYKGIA